ncbi:MAG: DUF5134 domain-containing protein [Segniliparus sp.]|uniref:DUF5134 domain-containing protein n=1 Tax=Segniliparus sp. TaxID=2804064 RepID=UPI003F2D169B
MIVDPWLSWVLVVLFVCSGGYCLWRLLRPGIWRSKVGHVFHLLMCLSMLAMIRPGTPTVPYPAQFAVFAVGTVWFVLLAFARSPRYQGMAGFVCASGKGTTWYHAVMMAAMLWMTVVMGGWLVGGFEPERPAQAASGHDHGGMAGMDMAGHQMGAQAPSPAQHSAPMWTTVLDVALGVVFFAAVLWWLRCYFELRKDRGRSLAAEAELLCETAMALGMGIMVLVMA